MSERNQSYVVKKKDLADIIHSGDADALSDFIGAAPRIVAETITGLLETGPRAWMTITSRLVQGALKVQLFQQFAREVNDLRRKGKIDPDFTEKKLGYQTWVELLTIIDEETPDEERLGAVKAMFFAVNKINSTDAQRIVGTNYFRLLSSSSPENSFC